MLKPNRVWRLITALFILPPSVKTAEYWISPEGQDTNPGTREQPFATIQYAAEKMKPGDRCLLTSGRYYLTDNLQGIHGCPGNEISFVSAPGEKAILDGTEPIAGEWVRHRKRIWKISLDREIWQLFVDGTAVTPARWPNARMEDGSAWDLKRSWRHISPRSSLGCTLDARPFAAMRRERGRKIYDSLPDGVNEVSLAETFSDMTGAVAVMNIGSWLTWAQYVQKHSAGSNTFTYSTDFSQSGQMMNRAAERFSADRDFWEKKNVGAEEGYYFLQGKLELLDCPGEWHLDTASDTLYLWTPDGSPPAEHDVSGKTQTYSIQAKECSYIRFAGISFFGTTFRFTDCHHMKVEDCHLLYPSHSKLVLGDFRRAEVTSMVSSLQRGDGLAKSHHNTLRNCVVEYADGPGFQIAGKDDLVENCLFRYIDVTCLGGGGEGTLNSIKSDGLTFRRNTVHTCGNSEGFRAGRNALVELNRLYNMGLTQHDGSAINVGIDQQKGTVVRHNWTHDTNRGGIRFDAVNSSTDYGTDGVIHHNVVWGSYRLAVKGDSHRVLHNTAFDNGLCDIGILNHPPMGGINKNTVTRNNLAGRIGAIFWKSFNDRPFPGIHGHNFEGDVRGVLVDPDCLDFRPKPKTQIIDAGKVCSESLPFLGDAPDLGAYERGNNHYWIPGRKMERAATPVPPDGAERVNPGAGLMWLEGRKAISHDIYLGRFRWLLSRANRKSEYYRGNVRGNIFDPGPLHRNKTYYWRVDTVTDSGIIPGKIWSFKIDDKLLPGDSKISREKEKTKTLTAPETAGGVRLDGFLDEEEWPGYRKLPTDQRIVQTRGEQETAGYVFAMHDREHLYIACFLHDLKSKIPAPGKNPEWGEDPGWEVNLQTVDAEGRKGPILVLHGFTDNIWESVCDAGASREAALRLETATEYASAMIGESILTAEFRIGFSGIGLSRREIEELRFNVGVFGDTWYQWAPTGKASWHLENAGVLTLERKFLNRFTHILQ